ncbi:hypothetical protein UFOVP235_28 [uncultured Caudovirales phage]|uniref:Uncharacterized protein n=1 Tax=uncultured Caudovirales phage TaxID=2100421 RepID=A0A6J7WTZ3_9CAUD|nr:hypothetical protein UFOVP235_28 [uncultured Caudovirales phage]
MMDYCDSPDEQAKNPETKRYFAVIANGDIHAFEFMWITWSFSHCFDDLVDGDVSVSTEVAARAFIRYVQMLSFNPFYLKHKENLFPFIVMAINRWCDGDDWKNSDDPDKRAVSNIIACGDVDLYFHVAFLTGGWDHLRKCKEFRAYDTKDAEQKDQ